jgi:hypothetical protein
MSVRVDPSARAWAIARGLVQTRRADHPMLTQGFICLHGANREHYWVANDGQRVLRGFTLTTADELQPGFLDAMARAGDSAT